MRSTKKVFAIFLVIALTITSISIPALAKTKAVRLAKKSVVLKIVNKNGKKTYGTSTIKVKKAKGVKILKKTYKVANKKIASVSKKGKVKAKKKGSTKITITVKYRQKSKTKKSKLTYKVTVKYVTSQNQTQKDQGIKEDPKEKEEKQNPEPKEPIVTLQDTDGDGIVDDDEDEYGSDKLVKDDTVTDTDGDGLTDYFEQYEYHTDLNKPDTDADNLTDKDEVEKTLTSPVLFDTDGDEISDFDSDSDGDGISNGREVYDYGTDPRKVDTDEDGLTDSDEINRNHSNPLTPDTDGDSATDGWEVEHGYDPLQYDNSFRAKLEQKSADGHTRVSADVVCEDGPESLSITETTENGLLSKNTPGYISDAFSLNAGGGIEKATISFTFDPYQLSSGANPTIYGLSDDTQMLEPLDTEIVGNVAKATVSHSSTYVLLDKTEVDKVWETEILPPDSVPASDSVLDIAFVIDYSASMDDNDPDYTRLSITNQFINKLRDNRDRAAIVKFAAYASLLVPLTSDKEMLNNAVNGIRNASSDGCDSEAGTNGTDGLHAAIEELKPSNGSSKYIIFLTDGEDTTASYEYDDLIADAVANHITIFSIGMGDADRSLLERIATSTNGKYYYANAVNVEDFSEGSLMDAFSEIENTTIDRELDSNNDGISDYYTRLMCEGKLCTGTGIPLFGGISYEDVQSNGDYDHDNLKNGDEVLVRYDEASGKTYLFLSSSPVSADTDSDGIRDDTDTAPRQKGLAGGIIGEVSLIACSGASVLTVALNGSTGHSFLMYHSFVNDTLDFSGFNRGFQRNLSSRKWTDSTEDHSPTASYTITADDSVTWGAGGVSLDDVKCAVYNMETWKHYSTEFKQINSYNYDYAGNDYITIKVTQKDLDQLINEFGIEAYKEYYVPVKKGGFLGLTNYNCTNVALNVWNHTFGTNYSLWGYDTPRGLYQYLQNNVEGVKYNLDMNSIRNQL